MHPDRNHNLDPEQLLLMRDSLHHRGPDDCGSFIASGVALGSRRLSILDLSERGRMPMCTPDKRYWITYNGEVYNYKELRAQLEGKGYVFRSHTDTEVVLYLYADEGPQMLSRLNGMFAIAIWDNRKRTLFLARDRLGVKPLYYYSDRGVLYFASEEKALFVAGVAPEFNTHTLEELLCFRYVAGERTPFVNVKRVLPGNYLIWKDGQLETRRWWNLSQQAKELRETRLTNPIEWFQETFDDAVRLRLLSDVPAGILLSGGLDSGSIAGATSSQGARNLASFTVRFSEAEYDEGLLAKQVADQWDLRHHQMTIAPDDLLTKLIESTWLNDEPLVHGNDPHLLAISEYAKSYVTVLLSGEGADETLGGYVRYQPLRYPRIINAARHGFPSISSALQPNGRLNKLSRFLKLGSLDRFVLFNASNVLPADLCTIGVNPSDRFDFRMKVLDEARKLYPREPVRQAMYSDQHTFLCSLLDRNDRMTMGASIECRVPFLDFRLVERLAALPTNLLFNKTKGKSLLRLSIGDRLPKPIQRYRKWGFGVPWGSYLRRVPELRAQVTSLPQSRFVKEANLEPAKIRNLITSFLKDEPANEMIIRQLIMLDLWYERVCAVPRRTFVGSAP